MKVSEFMTKEVIVCNENQTVSDAAKVMLENNFSVIPVVNDAGDLVGIVTESDFVGKDVQIPHALASLKRVLGENHYYGNIEEIYSRAKERKLSEVMSKHPVTVDLDFTLSAVVERMAGRNLKRLPVVDGGKIVGIVTRKNLIKAFSKIA